MRLCLAVTLFQIMTISKKTSLYSLILLPVLVLAIFSFLQTKKHLVEKLYKERQNIVSTSANILHEKLDRLNEIGLSMSAWPVFNEHFEDGHWHHAIELLKKIPNDYSYIHHAVITDTLGNPIAGLDSSTYGNFKNSVDKWHPGVSKNWEPYLSEVYNDAATPATIVTALAVPIKDAKKVKGILLLEVDVQKLLEWSSSIKVGESGFISVVDQKGQVAIAPSNMHAAGILDYSAVPAVKKALNGEKNVEVLYNPVEKADRLTSYEKVPGYQWAVIAQQDVAVIAGINKTLWPMLLFFVFVITMASLFAWLLIKGIKKQNEAKEQLELLTRQINQANDAIYTLDNNYHITSWNQGAQRMYGYTAKEALGKGADEILKTDLSASEIKKARNQIESTQHWTGELKRKTKYSKDIYVQSSISSIMDTPGKITGYVAVNFDITEQKKLREQVNHFANIVEQSAEAIFSRDINRCLISWNKGAEHLFGFTKEEAIGKTPQELGIVHLSDQEKKQIDTDLEQKSFWQAEKIHYRKDGSSFYGAVTANMVKDENKNITSVVFFIRDISIRKKLEDQLKKLNEELEEKIKQRTAEIGLSEKKYRYLFENNPLPIFIIDNSRYKFLDVNEQAIKHYGYSREEFLSMTALDIRPAEEKEHFVKSNFSITDEAHKINRGIWTHIKKDGTPIKVQISALPINIGETKARLILAHDVTEQEKAKEELARSEKRFRTLIESNNDVIALLDRSFNVVYRSPAAERITGWTNEDMLTQLSIKNIHPDDLEYAKDILKEAIANPGKEIKNRYRMLHKKGHYIWVEGVLTNWLDDENVQAIVSNYHDITEQKEASEKLAASERRFRALTENSVEVITLMDESFRLIYRSPAAERVTGWSNEDMINIDATKNIHPDDRNEALEVVRQVMANPGKQFQTIFRNLHKKGHYIWMEGTLTNWLHDENVKAIIFNYRDVTERKEAAEKIAESEKRYRTTLDNMMEGVQIIGFDWKYIYVNDALTRQSTYTKEQMIGHTVMELYPGVEDTPIFGNCLRCMKDRVSIQCENQMVFPDKTVEWFDQSFQPVPEGIFILSVNITERKKAEEKLKEQTAQLQTLSNNLPGVMIFQMIGTPETKRFTYISNGITWLTGKTSEEVMQNPALIYNRILPEDLPKMIEAEKQAYNNFSTFNVEARLQSFNNGIRWLNIISTPRKASTGELVWDGFHIDITERKNAAEAIKKSEEHYRLLVEQSADGIFLCDLQGNCLAANNAGCKMLGYSHEEIITKNLTDAVSPEDHLKIAAEILKLADGSISLTEWNVLRKDGSGFIGEVIARILPEGRIQLILRDITERKESELRIKKLNEELEDRVILRTEQLKKSNEEMEAFTYSVSHDLRAPLRGIIGFTSILEEEYSSKLDAEALRLTSVIKSNTLKMGQLIDDLLKFSRVSRHMLDKIPINTEDMVKQVINSAEIKAISNNVKWIIGALIETNGDLNTIRQVWINLISNAIKYSSSKPQQEIEIGSYRLNKQVVFFVKDNGVGFEQAYSHKLFKVFQRLHNPAEFDGTGVGLAIVDKIITKHGGKVWAKGEVGIGATFYFSLPGHSPFD